MNKALFWKQQILKVGLRNFKTMESHGSNVDGIKDTFYMSEIGEENKGEKGKCHKSSKNSIPQSHSTSNYANASTVDNHPHLASANVKNEYFLRIKKGGVTVSLCSSLVNSKKFNMMNFDRELKFMFIKIITDISFNGRRRMVEIHKALQMRYASEIKENHEAFFIFHIVASTPHCPCNDSSILADSLKHVSYVSKETKFLLFKFIKYYSGITHVEKENILRILINIPDNPDAQKASIIDKIRNMICSEPFKIQLVQCVLDLTLEECNELQCSLGGVDIDKIVHQVLPSEDDMCNEYEKYYELYNIHVDRDMNMFADHISPHLDISGIEEGIENEADWSPVKTILSNVRRIVVEEHVGEDLLSSSSVVSASSTFVAFQVKSCQKSEVPKRSAAQNLQRYRSHKKFKRQ